MSSGHELDMQAPRLGFGQEVGVGHGLIEGLAQGFVDSLVCEKIADIEQVSRVLAISKSGIYIERRATLESLRATFKARGLPV